MAQQVKNLPAIQETQETWVRFLGWKESLEKAMETHSSIRAWKTPWTEAGTLQSMGHKGLAWLSNSHTHTHTHTQLTYNIVLVSGVQENDSVIHI